MFTALLACSHCWTDSWVTSCSRQRNTHLTLWYHWQNRLLIWDTWNGICLTIIRIFFLICMYYVNLQGAYCDNVQYIPRNMHTVFALLCFVVVIHWLIFPYPSDLLHWHWGNLTIAPVPAKQPWWIWINTSCEFIMNDCITTTKQSTTKPCAYFLVYNVPRRIMSVQAVVGISIAVYEFTSSHHSRLVVWAQRIGQS